SFGHLTPGEYTLRAAGPEGSGQVEGIFIAANHQAKVQAVVEFEKPKTTFVFIPEPNRASTEQQTSRELTELRVKSFTRTAVPPVPAAPILVAEAPFTSEAVLTLPIEGWKTVPDASSVRHESKSVPFRESAMAAGSSTAVDPESTRFETRFESKL